MARCTRGANTRLVSTILSIGRARGDFMKLVLSGLFFLGSISASANSKVDLFNMAQALNSVSDFKTNCEIKNVSYQDLGSRAELTFQTNQIPYRVDSYHFVNESEQKFENSVATIVFKFNKRFDSPFKSIQETVQLTTVNNTVTTITFFKRVSSRKENIFHQQECNPIL